MDDADSRAYNDGASGSMFTGSTANEYAAYQAGRATLPGGGGIPMPPGTSSGIVLILLLPLIYTVMGALYPVAGFVMLASLVLILDLMADIGGILVYLVAVVWLLVALIFGYFLEKWLENWRWFRRLRHVARILLIGFLVHALAFGFFQDFDPATSFFERLTVLHVLIVAIGCIGAHFLSLRLDAGLRDRVSDRIPGLSWALHRFNPRRKANEAAIAALDERIRSGKY
jgi:hypothetical protein